MILGLGIPLVTNIFKVGSQSEWVLFGSDLCNQAEMRISGHELSNNLCPHFAMSRAELFNVVKSVVPSETSERQLTSLC